MTHLLPGFLALADGRGGVTDLTDSKIVRLAREARLPILAEINNYRNGGWDAESLHRALAMQIKKLCVWRSPSNIR